MGKANRWLLLSVSHAGLLLGGFLIGYEYASGRPKGDGVNNVGVAVTATPVVAESLTPEAAKLMATSLAQAMEKQDNDSNEATKKAMPEGFQGDMTYGSKFSVRDVDVETSNSVISPRVAKVIISFDKGGKTKMKDSMKQREARIPEVWVMHREIKATIALKDGKWRCVEAKDRCVHVETAPITSDIYGKEGDVEDAEWRVTMGLAHVPAL